jgi:23S rRNA (guanosine2251-2'-O)-methyltransferase
LDVPFDSAENKFAQGRSFDSAQDRRFDSAQGRPRTTMPVVVILDNVRSLYNTGAFFRTADGCGVEQLTLCGLTPRPDQGSRQRRAIAKTALGAELVVPWQHEPDTATAVQSLRARGYHIVAVETMPDAVDLYEWTPQWPLGLVFGHEKEGVTHDLGGDIETYVRIPMLGEKRSLNVATAAGIVLYELLRRRSYHSAVV